MGIGFIGLLGLTALVCGLGPATWIWPRTFRGKGLDFSGVLMIGFGMIALVSSYCFLLDMTVFRAVPLTILISIGLLGARYFHARGDLKLYFAQFFKFSVGYLGVAFVGGIIGFVLVQPSLVPYPGQQYRIGIDQFGYGITSQYLLDGGTKSYLQTTLPRETGQDNFSDALVNVSGSLSFNLQIASGFLLNVMRVGYPCTIAAIFKFLGQPLVYPYLFLMLFWPTLFLISNLWFFFRYVVGSSYFMALGIAAAISMNCNLLNTACEGQHSQWFISPYICLLFILLYIQRKNPDEGGLKNLALLTGALAAFIIDIYSESLMALLGVGLIMVIIDAWLGQKQAMIGYLRFGLAGITGILLTGPFIYAWIPSFIRQAFAVATGHAGFWQPHWASPAEIMGWFDIYTHPSWKLSDGFDYAALIVSIPLFIFIFYYLSIAKKNDVAFWLSPLLFIGGVFVQTCLVSKILNYAYMKSYTILFFPLCVIFYFAMEKQISMAKDTKRYFGKLYLGLLVASIIGTMTTGFLYLKKYDSDAEKLPSDITELRDMSSKLDFRNIAIITPHHFDIRRSIIYSAMGMFIPFNWLNSQDTDAYLLPHMGMPIYILAVKSEIPPGTLTKLSGSNQVVFQNHGILLLNTGYRISRFAIPSTGKYHSILPVDADFFPGETDRQQYEWTQILGSFGF